MAASTGMSPSGGTLVGRQAHQVVVDGEVAIGGGRPCSVRSRPLISSVEQRRPTVFLIIVNTMAIITRGVGTDGDHAQGLNTQLTDAAAVEQAVFNIEEAHSQGSPRCRWPYGHRQRHGIVHMELQVQVSTTTSTRMPDTRPMKKAPTPSTTSQGAVMATRPAREAFRHMETSGLPFLIQVKIMHTTVAVAGAMVVVLRILASWVASEAAAPLKPYQQNQRMKQPRAPSGNRSGPEWRGTASCHSYRYNTCQPGPQENGADQSGQASHHVDDGGTGEIVEAQQRQPALAIPDPTSFNGINHRGNHRGINAVGNKLRSAPP